MKEKWTQEAANEWYKNLGWIRGCNFNSSDCANRLDMWQSYKSEEKLATAERELALAHEIGFNAVRLWSSFDVYYAEPESYFDIFERYISLCDKYSLKVMMVLTHEEHLPRGEKFVPFPMGEQKYDWGYHQGFAPISQEQKAQKPYHYAEYPETREKFFEMIRETVRRYANDERIFCWNLYNEPGIKLKDRSIDILKEVFKTARAEDPIQPLCADIWRGINCGELSSEVERVALELSDVISFHCYAPYPQFVEQLRHILALGRPVFMTEWLHRISGNNVREIYPLLYMTNVGCFCWGFVAGKMQTYEPWNEYFNEWKDDMDKYDFTKWQHDLFRPSLNPYDPNEIKLIKHFNSLAMAEGR